MGLVWVWGLARGWREALPGSNGSRADPVLGGLPTRVGAGPRLGG